MIKIVRSLLSAMIIIPLLHDVAQAEAPRTFVSGRGNDATPCSVLLPCRTLQAALAQTTPGGEIYVLDSAGYGGLTINKAVSITSEGAVAGITVGAGVGIMINAGANDVVNLRGFNIDGGNAGAFGIQFRSGRSLNIQKSVVRGFVNSGINFAPTGTSSLFVSDTTVSGNQNSGILVSSNGSGTVNAALTRVTASGNGVGVFACGSNANVTLTDTVAGNNNYGIGACSSAVMVRNSTINNNAIGISADQSAIVRVGQSTVTANGIGWQFTNGGQVQSFGNNNVGGNATDGTLTSTVTLQ